MCSITAEFLKRIYWVESQSQYIVPRSHGSASARKFRGAWGMSGNYPSSLQPRKPWTLVCLLISLIITHMCERARCFWSSALDIAHSPLSLSPLHSNILWLALTRWTGIFNLPTCPPPRSRHNHHPRPPPILHPSFFSRYKTSSYKFILRKTTKKFDREIW